MKSWVIIGSALVAGSLIGGSIFIFRAKQSVEPKEASTAATPKPVAEEVWKDQAGFSFSYPKDITINKHDEDQQNYAHVEMTHKNHPGSIIVWSTDLPSGVGSVDAWVSKEKAFAGASAIDTALGGEPAKKLVVVSPSKKVYVGTVFDDLLWYVEVSPQDETYWMRVSDRVTQSFAFTPLSGSSSDAAEVGEEVDEEEVL